MSQQVNRKSAPGKSDKQTDPVIYPIDPWRIREEDFRAALLPQSESIFSVGNGYLGLRGNFEEGAPVYQNGTYINGFYEFRPLVYGEEAYGYAKHSQTMINLTDCKIIRLNVEGEVFNLSSAEVSDYSRVLDMQKGVLSRKVVFKTAKGKTITVESQRLVCYHRREIATIAYQISTDQEISVTLSSEMVSNESNQLNEWDPRKVATLYGQVLLPIENYADKQRLFSSHITQNSKLTLATMVDHRVDTQSPYVTTSTSNDSDGKVVYTIDLQPNKPFCLYKFMAYGSTKEQIEKPLERAVNDGFSVLLQEQKDYLDHFWSDADIIIDGSEAAQQGLRFSLFQILQSVGKSGERGIAAKGLTGQGYEGHYFWDSMIYVLPFFTYTQPQIARNLLKFRHSLLPHARERAKTLSHKGALFAWRTINGEEASAYFPAGTAQYHINADIIYALKKYVDVSGDAAVIEEFGEEMLVETADFWCDLGFFQGETFQIHEVTGPDEYTALVNNNVYTNLMARENLSFAYRMVKQPKPEWRDAAEKMYVPYDDESSIFPQDDNFFEREPWDFANTPEENYPLLLHYHPLEIYRKQVLKQSDLLLAMFLLRKHFTHEQIVRNFNFYDPLTTGDSSLSDCIQGIMAAEIGDYDKSLRYFIETVEMDLENVNHNVRDGVHIASMGGSWLYIIYGFAGMRDDDGKISFHPRLPKAWNSLTFKLRIRGSQIKVHITRDSTTYTLIEGGSLAIAHGNQEICLKKAGEGNERRNLSL
ncbi:MAG: glycoside hydrolase family 65 protein [Chlamydiales bacterium]|nr:glycoside hydrolase family 65 protein [Chlamydiia bacterium]MCP5507567.1 glycoside hydrolase family 65 protein [Chlamydiales bacterium]